MANWEAKVGRATGQAMRSSASPNSAPKHSSAPPPPPQIPPFRTPTLLVSSSSSFTSRPKLKPEEEEVCKTESKGEALQQRYGTGRAEATRGCGGGVGGGGDVNAFLHSNFQNKSLFYSVLFVFFFLFFFLV